MNPELAKMLGAEIDHRQDAHQDRLSRLKSKHEIFLVDPNEVVVAAGLKWDAAGIIVPTPPEGVDIDDIDADEWEEEGWSRSFPWHRIAEIRTHWWVPDPPVEVITGPSPYL